MDGVFFLLNQYPLCEYKMSREELFNVYDGAILTISVKRGFDKEQYKTVIKCGITKINASNGSHFDYEINNNIESLKNAIGILKMSRTQVMGWAKWINAYYKYTYFPQESISLLSLIVDNMTKLYTAIEYYKFRKDNLQYIIDLLKIIMQEENSFKKQNINCEENKNEY